MNWQQFATKAGDQDSAELSVDAPLDEQQLTSLIQAELIASNRQALEEAKKQGYNEGLEKARRQVERTMQPKIEEAIEQLITATKQLPSQLCDDQLWQQWCIELAIKLAKGVVYDELQTNDDQLKELVTRLLSDIQPPDIAVEVSCNKLFAQLAQKLQQQLPDNLRVVPHDDNDLIQITTKAKVISYDPGSAMQKTIDQWLASDRA